MSIGIPVLLGRWIEGRRPVEEARVQMAKGERPNILLGKSASTRQKSTASRRTKWDDNKLFVFFDFNEKCMIVCGKIH